MAPTATRLAPLLIALLAWGCGGGAGGDDPGSARAAERGAGSAPQAGTASAAKQPANQPPAASLEVSRQIGAAPLAMAFDGTGSNDDDGEVTSWQWDFGDGVSSAGSTASHTYDAPGSYLVRLTVVDDDDASASAERMITVEPAPPAGHRVSGRIRIQATSAVDSDTNDPSAPTLRNDDFDSAQIVATPATIGGYVGVAGRGLAGGAHHADGDHSDVFRFTALGGEVVSLAIASTGEDLDLRLYDAGRAQIDESLGVGTTEVLGAVPTAGEYYVQISTFGDAASNYVLTIGQAPAGAATALRASTDFVPGEVLLGPELPTALASTAGSVALPMLRSQRRVPAGERAATRASLDAYWQPSSGGLDGAAPLTAAQQEKHRTLEAVKLLRASGRYAWVEPNYLHRPLTLPNDEYFPSQWNLASLHLPLAWDLTRGSEEVVVAVIDSGVLPQHPVFTDPENPAATKLVDGYDFVSDPERALDGDGRDADPTDEGVRGIGGAASFHGSHVAGIVGARTNEAGGGTGSNVAGAGWRTRVMPLRVLGDGGGTSADLVEALRYAAGLPNATGELPQRPADIVNLSLGSPAFSEAERRAIEEVRARGIIVVAAAGNDADDAPRYPAAYDGVVSVAATTITDEPAFYSNGGPSIDVAAPGGDTSSDVNGDGIADGILSAVGEDADGDPATAPEHRIGVLAGTSMAAPHVAAVAALMKSVYPELTPEEFDAWLAAGLLTTDLGATGRDDRYGHGLVDAHRAVLTALQAAGGDGGDFAVLLASPASLGFGPFLDALDFRLGNAGSLPLLTTAPTVDAPWLTVAPVAVDDAGLGVWRASVDREALPSDGVFSASIRFDSDVNPVTVSVRVQRAAVDLSADAGRSYVVLTGEHDTRALYRTAVTARDGSYDFELTDVAPGRYRLYAGSDADHDDLICDAGESCGAWHTLQAPSTLEVDADVDGLEFITAFRGNLAPNGAPPFSAVSCTACSPR
ncbi:MAG: S8 family serine peptidase [Pseudomonadales bacterium]|jgi:serine protease|nr:S8 family serine peptidase [Pseudomonadales bacterium]